MNRKEFDKFADLFSYKGKLEISWLTGGQEGGSCWDEGESRHYGVSGEGEPEFSDLDAILLKVCPDMSFLLYKKLMGKVEIGDRRENDYYGNYSDYATKSIKIDDIWDFLVEHSLV